MGHMKDGMIGVWKCRVGRLGLYSVSDPVPEASIATGSAVAGCRVGAHAAVAIVAESFGAGVLPANDAAGSVELGTRNELAAAERMRKVALIPALNDALPMDNHLRRPGLQLSRLLAASARLWRHSRRTGLGVIASIRTTMRCGRGQRQLAQRPIIDLDVLVRPPAALLTTRCWRRCCGRAARTRRRRAGLWSTWARYHLTACKSN